MDGGSNEGSNVGQDRDNVKSRLILRQGWPKPKHSLQGLGDKRMFSHRDALDTNMKLGYG